MTSFLAQPSSLPSLSFLTPNLPHNPLTLIPCIQSLSQTYAIESSSFVLHCTPIMSAAGIDAHRTDGNPLFGRVGGGHSAIYAPDGQRMTAPLPPDQEGMLYAELNMDMLVTMRHFIDPLGHYSRPELLWLGVDDRVKGHVRKEGGKETEKEGEGEQVVLTGESGV